MRHLWLTASLLIVSVLIGCRASVDTRSATRSPDPAPDPKPGERRTRTEAEQIRDYAQEIHQSRDRIEETAAIKRLQEYLSDRNLTFNVFGQRAADDATIQSLSASPDTLRVRVDVYRGQQPIQSFTFIPRDNRNLALLGQ